MNFQMLFYLLPPILIIAVIFLLISFVRKGKKSIYLSVCIIIVILVALLIYYLPNDNILKNNKFESVSLSVNGIGEVEIHDRNTIEKIIEPINNYSYIRSAVETIERRRFEKHNVIELNMIDLRYGTFFHLYIFKKDPEKNFLQINSQRYKIKDSEKLTNELINVLNDLNLIY